MWFLTVIQWDIMRTHWFSTATWTDRWSVSAALFSVSAVHSFRAPRFQWCNMSVQKGSGGRQMLRVTELVWAFVTGPICELLQKNLSLQFQMTTISFIRCLPRWEIVIFINFKENYTHGKHSKRICWTREMLVVREAVLSNVGHIWVVMINVTEVKIETSKMSPIREEKWTKHKMCFNGKPVRWKMKRFLWEITL